MSTLKIGIVYYVIIEDTEDQYFNKATKKRDGHKPEAW
jgi:hypothetical protein